MSLLNYLFGKSNQPEKQKKGESIDPKTNHNYLPPSIVNSLEGDTALLKQLRNLSGEVLPKWEKLTKEDSIFSVEKINESKEVFVLKLEKDVSLIYQREDHVIHEGSGDKYKPFNCGEITYYLKSQKEQQKPSLIAMMHEGNFITSPMDLIEPMGGIGMYPKGELLSFFKNIAADIKGVFPYFTNVPTKSKNYIRELMTLDYLCSNITKVGKSIEADDFLSKLFKGEIINLTDFLLMLENRSREINNMKKEKISKDDFLARFLNLLNKL